MSATDELRKLLDERGMEYEKGCYVLDVTRRRATETAWVNNDCRYEFTEYPSGSTRLDIYSITPEQAIAATLGDHERTCEIYRVGNTQDWRKCSACNGLMCFDHPLDREHLNYCPNCGAKVVNK